MSFSLLTPLAIATVLAVAITTLHRRLTPALAARTATLCVVVLAAAAMPTLWLVAIGYLAHLPFLHGRLDWCAETFGLHEAIGPWLGVPAVLLSVLGIARLGRTLASYRRLRHHHSDGVEVAHHDEVFAVTLPGRGGHVLLSSSLVNMLDEAEQTIVIAHEQAHASHRHDRFLLVAQLAVAVLPPLLPLARRVQFSLERWADEHAVSKCGDRQLVARTLGRVALRSTSPAGALAFSGLGVPARVAALLAPPTLPLRSPSKLLLFGALGMLTAFSLYQWHHVVLMVAELCAL